MVYSKKDYYLNFSPRMQENLLNCGFEFIDEQRHITTEKKFFVYEKTYELQLLLGLFRLNNEKLNGYYSDHEIIKMFKENRIFNGIEFKKYEIKENKFTKINDILDEQILD